MSIATPSAVQVEVTSSPMAEKRKAVAPRVFTEQELEQLARELVARASGLSGSDFKKELPSDQKKAAKDILEAANQLAARRELYRWSIAKKVRFFEREPFDDLVRAIGAGLANGPLSEVELKRQLESVHRGFGDLFKVWIKAALSRGELFAHPPAKGSKAKRFGLSPDVGGLLKSVFTALQKVANSPAGKRVAKAQLLKALAIELDRISKEPLAPPKATERERFLSQLCGLSLETKSEGLLSIHELRARLPFDKQQFDGIALELMRDELVTLHHHDFPESLSEPERASLVVDSRGNHFVGIALRRAP